MKVACRVRGVPLNYSRSKWPDDSLVGQAVKKGTWEGSRKMLATLKGGARLKKIVMSCSLGALMFLGGCGDFSDSEGVLNSSPSAASNQPGGMVRQEDQISVETARQVATNYVKADMVNVRQREVYGQNFEEMGQDFLGEATVLQRGAQVQAQAENATSGGQLAYIFPLKPRGYVVVSAQRGLPPVIAHSYTSDFDWTEDPENHLLTLLRMDLTSRGEALASAPEVRARGVSEYQEAWDELASGAALTPQGSDDSVGVMAVSDEEQLDEEEVPLEPESESEETAPIPLPPEGEDSLLEPLTAEATGVDEGYGSLGVRAQNSQPVLSRDAGGGLVLIPRLMPLTPAIPWHQKDPYNEHCPVHNGKKTVVGCAATAAAQIMNYWQYPSHVSFYPEDTYYTKTLGIKVDATKANFPNVTYNSKDPQVEIETRAKLSYMAGVAHKMDYGPELSLAYLRPQAWDKLGFPGTKDLGISQWSTAQIIEEICAGRPVVLAVGNKDESHAIVVDGYDEANKTFNMNFGWEDGSINTWYELPSSNKKLPGSYDIVQGIVTGISPPNSASRVAAWLTAPANGATISSETTFTWNKGTGNSKYVLYLGTEKGKKNIKGVDTGANTSYKLPSSLPEGPLYLRLYSQTSAGASLSADYTFTVKKPTWSPATMISPVNGATISPETTFKWNKGKGNGRFVLYLGTKAGKKDIKGVNTGSNNAYKLPSPLPAGPLFVRLYSQTSAGTTLGYLDYKYTVKKSATMTSPVNGATIPPSTTFKWKALPGVTNYVLYVGRQSGTKDVYSKDLGTLTQATVSGLPAGNLHVRLYSKGPGIYAYNDYVYTVQGWTPAKLTSPAQGAMLNNMGSNTFRWQGSQNSEYLVYLGTKRGGIEYGKHKLPGGTTSLSVGNFKGGPLYVRLYSKPTSASTWDNYDDYLFNVRYKLSLKSDRGNGKYVQAVNAGGGAVQATADSVREWETFYLEDYNGGLLTSGDEVNIRSWDLKYLSADGNLSSQVPLRADRTQASKWEAFRIAKVGGSGTIGETNLVSLQALYNNKFVTAEGGKGKPLYANRDKVESWETFQAVVLR